MFSGYKKSVCETNKYREECGLAKLKNIYCNAHARRKFKEAQENYPEESQLFIECYKKIYRLEKIAQKRPPNRILRVRKYMKIFFERMRQIAMDNIAGYSTKSKIGKAMSCFLKKYDEYTYFINHKDLPMDNNAQERLM